MGNIIKQVPRRILFSALAVLIAAMATLLPGLVSQHDAVQAVDGVMQQTCQAGGATVTYTYDEISGSPSVTSSGCGAASEDVTLSGSAESVIHTDITIAFDGSAMPSDTLALRLSYVVVDSMTFEGADVASEDTPIIQVSYPDVFHMSNNMKIVFVDGVRVKWAPDQLNLYSYTLSGNGGFAVNASQWGISGFLDGAVYRGAPFFSVTAGSDITIDTNCDDISEGLCRPFSFASLTQEPPINIDPSLIVTRNGQDFSELGLDRNDPTSYLTSDTTGHVIYHWYTPARPDQPNNDGTEPSEPWLPLAPNTGRR
jgi:hypothetical protein